MNEYCNKCGIAWSQHSTVCALKTPDSSNQECWCNPVNGHMVGLPDPYVGKHWLSPSVTKGRDALIEDSDG